MPGRDPSIPWEQPVHPLDAPTENVYVPPDITVLPESEAGGEVEEDEALH